MIYIIITLHITKYQKYHINSPSFIHHSLTLSSLIGSGDLLSIKWEVKGQYLSMHNVSEVQSLQFDVSNIDMSDSNFINKYDYTFFGTDINNYLNRYTRFLLYMIQGRGTIY